MKRPDALFLTNVLWVTLLLLAPAGGLFAYGAVRPWLTHGEAVVVGVGGGVAASVAVLVAIAALSLLIDIASQLSDD